MGSFLGSLAADIARAVDIGQRIAVVVPNQRSRFRLLEILESKGISEAQAQVVQVDNFFQVVSGLELTDPIDLQLIFYNVYSSIKGKDAQSFTGFSKWAGMFLADINEIDLALADISSLYNNISAYKEMEGTFQEEMEAGELELQFRSFWKELPDYYARLKEKLLQAGLAYRGMAYRMVSERLKDQGPEWLPLEGRKMFWAGFGVFNPAEITIIKILQKHSLCEVRVDSDQYYLSDSSQEAGGFIRKAFENELDHLKFNSNDLLDRRRWIHLYPVAGKISQVKLAARLLRDIPVKEYKETVLVLADENLLEPLTTELQGIDVNITMGLPLRKTLVHRFMAMLTDLHAHHLGKRGFYYKPLIQLLSHPLASVFLSREDSVNHLRQRAAKENKTFLGAQEILEIMNGAGLLELLIKDPSTQDEVASWLLQVSGAIAESPLHENTDELETLAANEYNKRLKTFFSQVSDVLPQSDLKTLAAMMHLHLGRARIYIDPPNEKPDALQVMGMLETRLLDFKNVIIVGAMDDNLPARSSRQSFVPYVHRKHFGLPVNEDTEAMYAYHFYRLLQRTENMHLVWSTTTDEFSSGEPSRFVLQLEHELCRKTPHTQIIHHQVKIPLATSAKPLLVEKTTDVLQAVETYLQKSISPSALNTYVNSPLEFFYYHVLGFQEEELVEESIQMSSFGTAVHGVLEEYYTPFLGKEMDPGHLKSCKEQIREDLVRHFSAEYKAADLAYGRNHLMLELACHYVSAFLDYEISQMKLPQYRPVILKLEERLEATVNVDGRLVKFSGIADRIDRIGNTVRIIDYKTGLVTPQDLTVASLAHLTDHPDKAKALQLMLYQWMYSRQSGTAISDVCPMIYSFRRRKGGFQTLTLKDEMLTGHSDLEVALVLLVKEMLDPRLPFQHEPQSKYITI